MRFLSLTVEAFNRFRAPFTLPLDQQGIVLVEGENRDHGGSNGCLVGETLIDCPRDLIQHPRGIPIQDLVGKEFLTYAWMGGQMVLRRAFDVRCTGEKLVYRVVLGGVGGRGRRGAKGKTHLPKYWPPLELVGTADHLVLLTSGEWKALGRLVPGDRVVSLYRREADRTKILWTGGKAVSEQQFVCEQVHGPRPAGAQAHHVNERPYDHCPENIEWKDKHKHLSEHTSKRNLLGQAGWQKTGQHPRGMLGKRHNPDTYARPETVAKLRAAGSRPKPTLRGKKKPPHSAEAKARMRASAQRRWAEGRGTSLEALKLGHMKSKAAANHVVLTPPEPMGSASVYDMTVVDAHNFVANGVVLHNSGKSLCFEALLYGLYGRMPRHGDRVVTDAAVHPTRGVSGEVRLAIGEVRYIVRRKRSLRGKATFTIHYLDQGREVPYKALSRDTSQRAEDVTALLGMDYAAARAAIVQQAVGQELARAGFAAQMSVVESVLRFDQLSAAADLARGKQTATERALAHQEGLLVQQERLVAQIASQVETLDAHGDLTATIADVTTRLNADRDFVIHGEGLKDLLTTTRGQIERARRDALEAQGIRGRAAEEQQRLEAQLLADACPTCRRPFPPDEVEAQRAATREKIKAADAQGRTAHQRWEKAEHLAQRQSMRLYEYENEERARQAAAARVSGLEAQLAQLEGLQKDRQALIDHARMQQEEAEAEAQVLSTKVHALRRDAYRYGVWTRGYGRDGLQAELFAAAVPYMNNTARRLAPLILGDSIQVEFDPVRASQAESLIRISGSEAPTYAGLSSSQRQKVNLLVALGLRAAARLRLPDTLNLSVYDETFTALDSEGLQAVIRLLGAEHQLGDSVFIVTNDLELKRLLPAAKVMRVVRENGEAEVFYG